MQPAISPSASRPAFAIAFISRWRPSRRLLCHERDRPHLAAPDDCIGDVSITPAADASLLLCHARTRRVVSGRRECNDDEGTRDEPAGVTADVRNRPRGRDALHARARMLGIALGGACHVINLRRNDDACAARPLVPFGRESRVPGLAVAALVRPGEGWRPRSLARRCRVSSVASSWSGCSPV
jgi:hypothetical protein